MYINIYKVEKCETLLFKINFKPKIKITESFILTITVL